MFRQTLFMSCIAVSLLVAGCDDLSSNPGKSEEILIGALIPFTGTLAGQGEAVLVALQLAVEDVNSEYDSKGINKSVRLVYDDTGTDPEVADILLTSYINQGIKIIIGPMTSAEVLEVQETIDNSNSMLISQSSTATALSLEDDHIFRIVPDDAEMAEALSAAAWENEARHLLLCYRDDTWGSALSNRIESEFESLGGNILLTNGYYSYRQSVFQESLNEISAGLTAALTFHDAATLAVQLSSFDEGTDILSLAAADTVLGKIKWFGSDGIAMNSYLLEVSEAVEFARLVDFAAPILALEESAAYSDLVSRMSESLGYEPGTYGVISYDALRAAAAVLSESVENETISAFRTRVFSTLDGYEGVTGTIELNSAGDREGGSYSFWRLNASGTPSWELAYTYRDGEFH